jgi:hypothetical protein
LYLLVRVKVRVRVTCWLARIQCTLPVITYGRSPAPLPPATRTRSATPCVPSSCAWRSGSKVAESYSGTWLGEGRLRLRVRIRARARVRVRVRG